MKENEKKIKRVKRPSGKPKTHNRRPAAGDHHPGPWRSELWPHLDSIRKLRLARRTWAQVAEAIHQAGGPKVAATTCYNFYKRAVNLSRKGKLPLGFVDPFQGQVVAPEPAEPGAAPQRAPADEPRLTPREAKERIRRLAEKQRQRAAKEREEQQKLRPYQP